jgi:large repetitive protein
VTGSLLKRTLLFSLLVAGSLVFAAPAFANVPPTASFTYSPSAPVTGETITFTSTSTDPDGHVAQQYWDLDNDGRYDDDSGSTATVSDFSAGDHRVGLLVMDDRGWWRTTSQVVRVAANRAPTAAFSANPGTVDTGQATTLTSTSSDPDGRPLTESWDLDNDGTFGDKTGSQVSASWNTNGTHTVSLRVTDSGGSVRTVSHDITVNNRPPTAEFGMSQSSVDSGTPVTFTSSSSDPDGSIASYAWDFDGNGTTDATGASVSHSFAHSGTPNVTLKVTDDDGATRSVSHSLTVRNRPPVAAFGMSSSSVDSGTPVTFTSSSSDPDGSVASYAWDFDGDGTTDATGATVSHSFAHSGTPNVTLTVTDNEGAARSVSHSLSIGNRAPTPAFTMSAADVSSGDPITFTSTSTDPDGSITSYAWDFNGDGVTDATGPVATRSWLQPGTPSVTLTVTDDDGAKRSTSHSVSVHNRPPDASFRFSPSDPQVGELVTLTSTSSDSDGHVVSERWDLDDDGAFDDATGSQAQARFSTAGKHKVSLQVTDDDGAKTVVSHTFTVAPKTAPAPFVSPKPSPTSSPPLATPISPRMLNPFPLVRISGMTTTKGVIIDLLSVRTGHGTKVTIRCKGRGCPYKRKAVIAKGKVHRRRMPGFHHRHLRAGTVLEVYVTRGGAIGKYTRFRVRRLLPPKRLDSCTAVSVAKVKRCPAA